MIPPGMLTVAPVRPVPLAAPFRWDPQLFFASLWFAGALLVGAIVVALINRWRKSGSDQCLTASDQLAHFRSLYEQGEISQEEFERLRGLLGGRIRRTAKDAAPGSPAPAAGPPSTAITAPQEQAPPQNPSRPPDQPETGIRPG